MFKLVIEASWNVMAQAQKPVFVFRLGCHYSRLLAAEVCASAVVMQYTPCSEVVWRVQATQSIRQFPLQFPSCASPCAIIFQLKSICHRHLYCLDASWNVIAHAQKPDFVFRAKRTSPFKSAGRWGRQFSRLLAAEVRGISGSNAGYSVFRGSVKGTGYPLHSPVSPFTSPHVRHRVPSHFNGSLHV